jgi:hypothetical protein
VKKNKVVVERENWALSGAQPLYTRTISALPASLPTSMLKIEPDSQIPIWLVIVMRSNIFWIHIYK